MSGRFRHFVDIDLKNIVFLTKNVFGRVVKTAITFFIETLEEEYLSLETERFFDKFFRISAKFFAPLTQKSSRTSKSAFYWSIGTLLRKSF